MKWLKDEPQETAEERALKLHEEQTESLKALLKQTENVKLDSLAQSTNDILTDILNDVKLIARQASTGYALSGDETNRT